MADHESILETLNEIKTAQAVLGSELQDIKEHTEEVSGYFKPDGAMTKQMSEITSFQASCPRDQVKSLSRYIMALAAAIILKLGFETWGK